MFFGQNIRYDGQNLVIQKDVVLGYNEKVCVYCQVDKNTSVSYPMHVIQYNEPTPDNPDVTAAV